MGIVSTEKCSATFLGLNCWIQKYTFCLLWFLCRLFGNIDTSFDALYNSPHPKSSVLTTRHAHTYTGFIHEPQSALFDIRSHDMWPVTPWWWEPYLYWCLQSWNRELYVDSILDMPLGPANSITASALHLQFLNEILNTHHPSHMHCMQYSDPKTEIGNLVCHINFSQTVSTELSRNYCFETTAGQHSCLRVASCQQACHCFNNWSNVICSKLRQI